MDGGLRIAILLTALSGYFALLLVVVLKRGLREQTARLLTLYLLAALIWSIGLAGSSGDDTVTWRLFLEEKIALYGPIATAIAFLPLGLSFLPGRQKTVRWWLLGIVSIAVAITLDLDVFSLGLAGEGYYLLIVTWASFSALSTLFVWRGYRPIQSPLHRNRIRYVLLAICLMVMGDGLWFTRLGPYDLFGTVVKLVGASMVAYAFLSHRLPDLKNIGRRTISYVIITLLTIALFLAISVIGLTIFEQGTFYGAVLVVIALAVLYQPLRRGTQRIVDRLLFGETYEYGQVVRNYSQQISSIVDLGQLADTAIGLIRDLMDVERGALLLVESDLPRRVNLRPIQSETGDVPIGSMALTGDSPIAVHLGNEDQPLTQYDVDVLPGFRDVRAEEREWFRALNMELFVPIKVQGRLTGLLALGPKSSRDPYLSQDVELLCTLADQTAVALENARLFSDLRTLNQSMVQLNADLEAANKRLREADRLKSSFISVITHELRSPFVAIDLSLQLIKRYGVERLSPEQREQLEQLTTGLREMKTMIDNLISFASLLSKQGDLKLEPLDLATVIRETTAALAPVAQSRGVSLIATLPDTLPTIQGDRERLSEAVYHLVHNAIKFNRPGGRATVRCAATDGHVTVEVEDTGIGIPPDRLEALWAGFTQMADPLRRGVEGLGLGLALVRYVVHAHGGEVIAHSRVNVGSTFGFRLPIAKPRSGLRLSDVT